MSSEAGQELIHETNAEIISATKDEAKPPPLPTLWHNRDFMLLWSGQIVSNFGSGMSGFAIPLLILALTQSPEIAGIAGALGFVPYIILSLPVGALIDRWERKRVMIICDAVRAVNIATIPIALLANSLTIWQIYIVALVEGSCFVCFNIAETAALPRVVDRVQLPSASAMNETAATTIGIISPTISGFLFANISRAMPFVVDAVSYAGSVISLFFIRTPFQLERKVEQRSLRQEMAEGLRWLWQQPLVRFIAFLSGALNIVGGASALLIIVLAKQHGADEAAIGLTFGLSSLGGVVGALLAGRIQHRFRFGQIMPATVWVQAIVYPLLLIAPNLFIIGLLYAINTLTAPIYIVTQFSYRLALIPDRLQGRVNSAVRFIAFAGIPFGSFLGGLMLERIGTTPTIAIFSAWLLIVAIATTLNTHIRHAPPIEQVQAGT